MPCGMAVAEGMKSLSSTPPEDRFRIQAPSAFCLNNQDPLLRMSMTQNSPDNGELTLAAGAFTLFLCTLFGANAVAIKVTLTGLGAFTTAAFRFALASVVLLLWAVFTGRPIGLKKGQTYQVLVMAVLFTTQLGLFYIGLSRTTAARGTLMINLQPFFLLTLAHFFIPGDRITKKKVFGLLMGFSGMALVFLGRGKVTSEVQVGDLMILLTAFLWALNTVYTKRIINAFHPFQVVLYPMLFSVPCFSLAGWFFDPEMVTCLDAKVLWSLLYQGLVTASFGFVAWNSMLKKYGAVSLHSFIFIMPVAGVLLGGLILGETITLNIALALVLIASGIVVVNLKSRKYFPLFPQRGV